MSDLIALLQEADDAVCRLTRTVPDRPSEFDIYEAEILRYLEHKLPGRSIRISTTNAMRADGKRDVYVTMGTCGEGAQLRVGRVLREKQKLKRPLLGYPGGMAKMKPFVEYENVFDGLTATECYNRYVLMQRECQTAAIALTPRQLEAAKHVWAGYLYNKVEASDHARREAERLQVVVDFEED